MGLDKNPKRQITLFGAGMAGKSPNRLFNAMEGK
jgi:hypothetical protein